MVYVWVTDELNDVKGQLGHFFGSSQGSLSQGTEIDPKSQIISHSI
jgi:hypothetical protein